MSNIKQDTDPVINLSKSPEKINDALRKHVERLPENWVPAKTLTWLHEWAERLNRELSLGLVTPAIGLAPLRSSTLADYNEGRSGFGLKHEIRFNVLHLGRPQARILTTLFHEMIHQWQLLHGKPGKEEKGHNKEFKAKVLDYGLELDKRGCFQSLKEGPFLNLLKRHGVDVKGMSDKAPGMEDASSEGDDENEDGTDKPAKKPSKAKLQKYSCGCTNVRCAVELEATCTKEGCGGVFQPADAAW